jgi:hypothetical protein
MGVPVQWYRMRIRNQFELIAILAFGEPVDVASQHEFHGTSAMRNGAGVMQIDSSMVR